MKLYFLRHGMAVERPEWKGDDAERPLTEEGKERMARSAAVLARLDLELDAILTSPLTRARQTADIVAEALDLKDKLLVESRLGTGFSRDQLAEILRDHAGCEALLLVGHEPSFSETISALIGGGRIVCKKGGLACVKLSDPTSLKGELLWLIPPRLLAQ
jgi:phosphohistidine phosphatase